MSTKFLVNGKIVYTLNEVKDVSYLGVFVGGHRRSPSVEALMLVRDALNDHIVDEQMRRGDDG